MKAHNGNVVVASMLVLVLLFGCVSTVKISTLAEDPECMTSLEGYYHCKQTWAGPTPPAIVVAKKEEGSSSRVYYKAVQVEIISLDDEGLTIKPIGKGSSVNLERTYRAKASLPELTCTYYKYSELEAVIDEDGKVLYGSIPMKFSSELFLELDLEPAFGSSYSSGTTPFRIRLTPNERFAFCFPSGTYKVAEIRFIDGSNNVGRGVDCPDLKITVNGGCSNYVGDLFLNLTKSEAPDSVRIRYGVRLSYEIISSSDDETGAIAAGIIGGAVGGGLFAALSKETGIGERELLVGIDDAFAAQCEHPLKLNLIKRGK